MLETTPNADAIPQYRVKPSIVWKMLHGRKPAIKPELQLSMLSTFNRRYHVPALEQLIKHGVVWTWHVDPWLFVDTRYRNPFAE